MKKRITVRASINYADMWNITSTDGKHQTLITKSELASAKGKLHHLARQYYQKGMPINTRSLLNILIN